MRDDPYGPEIPATDDLPDWATSWVHEMPRRQQTPKPDDPWAADEFARMLRRRIGFERMVAEADVRNGSPDGESELTDDDLARLWDEAGEEADLELAIGLAGIHDDPLLLDGISQ